MNKSKFQLVKERILQGIFQYLFDSICIDDVYYLGCIDMICTLLKTECDYTRRKTLLNYLYSYQEVGGLSEDVLDYVREAIVKYGGVK